jgi:hypothetical protein
MTYRISCPDCQARVPRWQCFLTPTLDYRCRKCGAKFRISPLGWLVALLVIVLQVLWFCLTVRHIISPRLALVLVLVTCILSLWLLPYLIPVNRSRPVAPKT